MKATRRQWLLTLVLATGTGAALGPLLSKVRSAGRDQAGEWFAETYRGRRIVGGTPATHGLPQSDADRWHVTVDGRPLHLMRRADGSWMTMIDHYQSYPTPLAAARAAVDELGPTTRLGAPGAGDGPSDGSGVPGSRTGSLEDHPHGLHA
ncbi:tyrosinase family oxidase copper chaperone [Streptomyces sp. NPDC004783]|uniref:tyrosinase family oxidase copper chaperone n=1 Tax=unclassified Streptomyces TaxID=2593676 RepID=UPI0033B619FB